jgi:hypothetical protein
MTTFFHQKTKWHNVFSDKGIDNTATTVRKEKNIFLRSNEMETIDQNRYFNKKKNEVTKQGVPMLTNASISIQHTTSKEKETD